MSDHACISGFRIPAGKIMSARIRFFLFENITVPIHIFFRCLKRNMGNGGGVIEKEGVLFVFSNEIQSFIQHQIRGVFIKAKIRIIFRVIGISIFRQFCAQGNKFVV
jgi:hypothetical protein